MALDPLPLGEFEQMVLLAVMRAGQNGGEAYGITVYEEIALNTRRQVLRGAVYMTLDRLEKKGLLASWTTAKTAERGGRAKRCYKVTAPALAALRESQRSLLSLWKGINLAPRKVID